MVRLIDEIIHLCISQVLQKLDVDGNGEISKEERKAKLKQVLGLFENDMPEEHSNDYQDVYIYRQKRDEVPEEDEMEYHFDGNHEPIDDGEGQLVNDDRSDADDDDDTPDDMEYEESEERVHEEL